MSEMKSAYEKAMERVEKLGKATAEEMAVLDAAPLGNRLAAKYMNEPEFNLEAEIAKYRGTGTRKLIVDGIQEIFLRYVALPQSDVGKANIKKAKQGLLVIKENKKAVEQIFSQLDNLFNYYEQARQQAFSQLKQMIEQRMGQQMRAAGAIGRQPKMDVTSDPQFREELAKALGDMTAQYEQALSDQKQRLAQIQ